MSLPLIDLRGVSITRYPSVAQLPRSPFSPTRQASPQCLSRQTLTLTLTLFAASEAEVAAAVRAACETVGFFYLVGHGVEATLMKEAMMASREYFALTEDEKRRPHDIHGQLLSEAPDFRG
jgi:hypothetical protein